MSSPTDSGNEPETLKKRGTRVTRAVTIRKTPQVLYTFWRDVSNLPQIIKHPVTITCHSREESRWIVSAPFGHVEWNSLITSDTPNESIAWRSREGDDVDHAGSIKFQTAPGDEGTEVIVSLEYDPPGGKLGAFVAKFTRDSASSQVYDALHRFKALMEAGEIPTVEGQSVGGSKQRAKGKQ